jgi:cytoskeletal protein RodZ
MSRLLKFLMWEVTLLTSLYLWKTYGKQWQAYWDMFTQENPDVKNSFDEVKEAIDKMESAEKSKKESTVEKEAKVTPSTPASTVSKEKADAVEKKEEKVKVPTTRKTVNPPKEEKVEAKPVAKTTKPATKTAAKAPKKTAEVVKADIANPNPAPAKKPAAKKPKAATTKTDKKD